MTILPFQPSFCAQVIETINTVLKEEFRSGVNIKKDPDLFSIEQFYMKDGGNFWVVFNDNLIIGTIAIKIFEIHGERIAYLKRFYLKSSCRGRGIGKALLETATSYAKTNNLNSIVLGTNNENLRAIDVFHKAGFRKFNMNPELPTYGDNIFMRKIL
jgi:ribosomal protein S18 acetylase RimI-like enzyme